MINEDLLLSLIKNDPQITMLNFSYQPIEDHDISSLCFALTNNNMVNTILLNATNMTDQSANKIADLLRVNPHLKRVELARNKGISDKCIQQIMNEFNDRFTDNNNFLYRLSLNPHRKMRCIDETNQITSDEFITNFYKLKKPLIVRGAIKNTSAYKKWSPHYFNSSMKMMDVLLTIHNMKKKVDHYFYRWDTLAMKMYQAISLIEDTSSLNNFITRYYLQQAPLSNFPKIKNDITLPVFIQDIHFDEYNANLWFSQHDTFSGLHFDHEENIFMQVYGDKSVLLYAPQDSKYLCPHYPKPFDLKTAPHVSRITNIDALDDFSTISQHAIPYHAKLSAGDILYLPKAWWHEFRSLNKTSISVNFWFEEERKSMVEIDKMMNIFSQQCINNIPVCAHDIIMTCTKKLIQEGKINYFIGDDQKTILQLAVIFHVVDAVKLLLENALIKPNVTCTTNPFTPFFMAIHFGYLDLVELFLKHNDINIHETFKYTEHTPLSLAIESGHSHIYEYLKTISKN